MSREILHQLHFLHVTLKTGFSCNSHTQLYCDRLVFTGDTIAHHCTWIHSGGTELRAKRNLTTFIHALRCLRTIPLSTREFLSYLLPAFFWVHFWHEKQFCWLIAKLWLRTRRHTESRARGAYMRARAYIYCCDIACFECQDFESQGIRTACICASLRRRVKKFRFLADTKKAAPKMRAAREKTRGKLRAYSPARSKSHNR